MSLYRGGNEPLKGTVVAVTGGANGIGLGCAELMAKAGATVVLVDRDKAALEKAVAQIGANAIALELDLFDNVAVKNMAAEIVRLAGGLDILYANAGCYIGGNVSEQDPDDWDRMLRLNVNVALRTASAVMPHMIAQKSGDIIFTSSIAGIIPIVWEPVYCATKYAIQGFMHSARRQLVKDGVRLMAVLPGPVVTPLIDNWPKAKLDEALASDGLMYPIEVAECVLFMVTRPRNVSVRDLVIIPNGTDLC